MQHGTPAAYHPRSLGRQSFEHRHTLSPKGADRTGGFLQGIVVSTPDHSEAPFRAAHVGLEHSVQALDAVAARQRIVQRPPCNTAWDFQRATRRGHRQRIFSEFHSISLPHTCFEIRLTSGRRPKYAGPGSVSPGAPSGTTHAALRRTQGPAVACKGWDMATRDELPGAETFAPRCGRHPTRQPRKPSRAVARQGLRLSLHVFDDSRARLFTPHLFLYPSVGNVWPIISACKRFWGSSAGKYRCNPASIGRGQPSPAPHVATSRQATTAPSVVVDTQVALDGIARMAPARRAAGYAEPVVQERRAGLRCRHSGQESGGPGLASTVV
ncbi:hypothetical protein FQR65_LT20790 [Abscondita terminalis]|nr:hypothetical protein FQR65_LT20790 [Abscondita terminalis]